MNETGKNIAVLDLTHGGIAIAKKLSLLGFGVYAVDVYQTVTDSVKSELLSIYNIGVSSDPPDIENIDTVVSPVHLDPDYILLKQAKAAGKK